MARSFLDEEAKGAKGETTEECSTCDEEDGEASESSVLYEKFLSKLQVQSHKNTINNDHFVKEKVNSFEKRSNRTNGSLITEKNIHLDKILKVVVRKTDVSSTSFRLKKSKDSKLNEKSTNADGGFNCSDDSRYLICNDTVNQVKLLFLTLSNLNKNHKIFLLTDKENTASLRSLSDAIFCVEKKDVCTLFTIRAVSSSSEIIKRIGLESLFCADFEYETFLNNYTEARGKMKNKNVDEFVVYTNLQIDQVNFEHFNIDVDLHDDKFKLSIPEEASILKNFPKVQRDFYKMAKTLRYCHENQTVIQFEYPFTKYHSELIKEVLEINSEINAEDDKKYGKFSEGFIEGNSEGRIVLSRAVSGFRNCCLREFQNQLEGKRFIFSPLFEVEQQDTGALPVLSGQVEMDMEKRKSGVEFFKNLRFSNEINIDPSHLEPDDFKFFNFIREENIGIIEKDLLENLIETEVDSYNAFKYSISKSIISKTLKIPEAIGVVFKDEVTKKFRTKLELTYTDAIVLLRTNYFELTRHKIKQLIQATPDNHVYVNFDVMIDLESMREHVLNACRLESTIMLIIEIDKEIETDRNKFELCEILRKILDVGRPINIIAFGYCRDLGNFEDECITLIDTLSEFNDVTDDSKTSLFERLGFTLHGRKLGFKDVMEMDSFNELMETPEIFCQLLTTKNLSIGENIVRTNIMGRKLTKRDGYMNEKQERKILVFSRDSGCSKNTSIESFKEYTLTFPYPLWFSHIDFSYRMMPKINKDKILNKSDALRILNYRGIVESKIFEMCYDDKLKLKFYLYFDSLEKLDSESLDTFIELLKLLQNSGVEKVCLSCTPELVKQIQKKLDIPLYYFKTLTSREKSEIIKSYWRKHSKVAEDYLDSYAKRLLKNYSSNKVDFTSAPLTLKMLAALHEPLLKTTSPETFKIAGIDDHYQLYERFEKIATPYGNKGKIQKLALRKLLKPAEHSNFYQYLEVNKILNESLKHSTNTIPNIFAQVSFYEYFGAQYLVEILNCLTDDARKNMIELYCNAIEYLMKNTSRVFFSTFINYFTKADSDSSIKLFIEDLVKFNCRDTVLAILNYDPVNINKNEIKQITLRTAATSSCKKFAMELLLLGADATDLERNQLESLTEYVASQIPKVQPKKNDDFHKICVKLFNLAPSALANKNYPRLLNFFFINGYVELLETLLKKVKKEAVHKIFQLYNGKNPLQYVNLSRSLTDDERLHMIMFLNDNMKINLRDEVIICSILEGALKANHLKSFDFFISCYPSNGYISFLKYSLRENMYENIDFLCKRLEYAIDQSNYNNTILLTAIDVNADLEMIKFLVGKTGINDFNSIGENALCLGLKKGVDLIVIKYLVEAGADLNSVDKSGILAWCHAFSVETKYSVDQQMELFNHFFKEGKARALNPPPCAKDFLGNQCKKFVDMKLEYFENHSTYNLNYNEKNEFRLLDAIEKNDFISNAWARFLMMCGADVNVVFSNGQSALQYALSKKNYKVARFLFEHKANFDYKNPLNKNLLDPFVECLYSGPKKK